MLIPRLPARAAVCVLLLLCLMGAAAEDPPGGETITALFDPQAKTIEYNGVTYKLEHEEATAKVGTGMWWISLCISVGCVITAALVAGLTMGLVSVDPFELHVVLNSDVKDCKSDKELEELITEKKYATKVLPLVQRHHFLLVTLLLANAGANETLPIFLDRLVPAWAAIVLAVTFILIFGEILPSAIFTGPRRLQIAAKLSRLVWGLMILVSPIAWPISKLLDHWMGEQHLQSYTRHELKAIVRMHGSKTSAGAAGEPQSKVERMRLGGLTDDEITIIGAVLDSSAKTANDVLIPLSEVYMLSKETILNINVMADIMATGHSRVPVFDGSEHNVRGILLIKKLMVLGPENNRPISQLPLRKPICTLPTTPLLDLLNEFQLGKSHMALVTNKPRVVEECMRTDTPIPCDVHMMGVVCLEDVIEQMIGEPIHDEFDVSQVQKPATIREAAAKIAAIRKAGPAAGTLTSTPSVRPLLIDHQVDIGGLSPVQSSQESPALTPVNPI